MWWIISLDLMTIYVNASNWRCHWLGWTACDSTRKYVRWFQSDCKAHGEYTWKWICPKQKKCFFANMIVSIERNSMKRHWRSTTIDQGEVEQKSIPNKQQSFKRNVFDVTNIDTNKNIVKKEPRRRVKKLMPSRHFKWHKTIGSKKMKQVATCVQTNKNFGTCKCWKKDLRFQLLMGARWMRWSRHHVCATKEQQKYQSWQCLVHSPSRSKFLSVSALAEIGLSVTFGNMTCEIKSGDKSIVRIQRKGKLLALECDALEVSNLGEEVAKKEYKLVNESIW